MTEPDVMAVLPNNDDIGHTTELLRKTDSWELIENRAINRISSDCNSAIILRPNAKQYDPSLIKTDPNHTFPVVFDDDIIKYGFTKTSGNSTGYILPGFHNDNPGFFHINMNNQSGVIYHRNFDL